MNLKEFEQILSDMTERSRAFDMVKRELQVRGHWKNKARHIPTRKDLLAKKAMKERQFAPASSLYHNTTQVIYNSDEFNGGFRDDI